LTCVGLGNAMSIFDTDLFRLSRSAGEATCNILKGSDPGKPDCDGHSWTVGRETLDVA
jgi:hypothetical protein